MEVGMGGRLDATNVADPELSVITTLGRDHSQYLGSTSHEIAQEICGVASGKTVLGTEREEILEEVSRVSDSIVLSKDVDTTGGHAVVEGTAINTPCFSTFQAENLGTAAGAVDELEELSPDILRSVEDMSLRARMEVQGKDPLEIHDGAHNPSAVEAIMEYLPESFNCVFNASKSKDYAAMIETLEPKVERFYFTRSDVSWASEDPKTLASCCDTDYVSFDDPEDALRAARRGGIPVLATGSMYLMGSL